MSSAENLSFKKYMEEVLGLESLVLPEREKEEIETTSLWTQEVIEEMSRSRTRMSVFLDHSLLSDEKELLLKMIAAMKLDGSALAIFTPQEEGGIEVPDFSRELNSQTFHFVLYMGNLESSFFPELALGEMVEVGGVPSVKLNSPKQILVQPELKRPAWEGLKKVMQVLNNV